MDHDVVVRLKMTERYLLGELDPEARGEFEEHFFDCSDCALDARAGALFVEQSKIVLAEKSEPVSTGLPVGVPIPAKSEWFAWLRPAFTAPLMVLLLAVIGYQNLVTYPQMQIALNSPRVLPWASVNVGTWGSGGPIIPAHLGEGFLLFVRIPPDGSYSSYVADLHDPTGKLEWSITIPASSAQDQWPVQVPGANRAAGSYILIVRGVTAAGESKEVGRASFELQIPK
jgi:anti-sigma factor RsiW